MTKTNKTSDILGFTKRNKVFVEGGDKSVKEMFLQRKYLIVNHLASADFCVFTGGADISPELYGEDPHSTVRFVDKFRDQKEHRIFDNCRSLGLPTVGICRGGQLLNVLNRGKLWQDVNKHRGSHKMTIVSSNREIKVSSTHHQMMIPSEGGEILAYAGESTIREKMTPHAIVRQNIARPSNNVQHWDPEIVWYPATKSLCVQPHPEHYGSDLNDLKDYFFSLIEEKVIA